MSETPQQPPDQTPPPPADVQKPVGGVAPPPPPEAQADARPNTRSFRRSFAVAGVLFVVGLVVLWPALSPTTAYEQGAVVGRALGPTLFAALIIGGVARVSRSPWTWRRYAVSTTGVSLLLALLPVLGTIADQPRAAQTATTSGSTEQATPPTDADAAAPAPADELFRALGQGYRYEPVSAELEAEMEQRLPTGPGSGFEDTSSRFVVAGDGSTTLVIAFTFHAAGRRVSDNFKRGFEDETGAEGTSTRLGDKKATYYNDEARKAHMVLYGGDGFAIVFIGAERAAVEDAAGAVLAEVDERG